MSKRKINEILKDVEVKKAFLKDYDYLIMKDDKKYHLKIIKVNSSSILSINSKIIWEIKYGRHSGVSFKTSSNSFVDLKNFNTLDNKIIVFKSRPFKILKYLNESDLKDISGSKKINDIQIFNCLNELKI